MTSSVPDPVTAGSTTPDPHASQAPAPATRVAWRGLVVENAVVLVVFAVAGVAAGWVWERWATPPDGLVLDKTWNLGLTIEAGSLANDADSFTRAFGIIGTFVLVCAAVGLVLGVTAAFACRRSELVTLAVVAGSSVLAAVLCYRVGLTLGPPDPTSAAAGAADGTVLAGDLAIDQITPFVVLPLTALVGLAVTYLFTTGVSAGVEEARRVDLAPAPPVERFPA